MNQQIGEYYTLQGAAMALGLSYWTVYGYVRRHRVPTLRLGQTLLVKLEDMRALGAPGPAPAGTEAGGTRPPGSASPAPTSLEQ